MVVPCEPVADIPEAVTWNNADGIARRPIRRIIDQRERDNILRFLILCVIQTIGIGSKVGKIMRIL